MSHLAGKPLSAARREGHMFGQVIAKVFVEGQLSLAGVGHHLSIPEQLNSDFWWVKPTHMTNEDVVFPHLSWTTAVHLNLGWHY